MQTKALLYTVDGEWYLEAIGQLSKPKGFMTATEARAWARLNKVTVKRVPNCDSK
jgi:hypothetical protein